MASGLIALLDDVAGLTKLAAASLDDVAGATGRVGLKAAGVVVDDAAVTPRYVTGLSPDRELPIIGKIALGSLRNKLLILLPAALLLSAFAPWAVTPLLVVGGVYLCFEGAEKVLEPLFHRGEEAAPAAAGDPARLEADKVRSAVRTDLILSAEIMAIALGEVADRSLAQEAVILALVAVGITAGVYGVVGVIVKVDDLGAMLARGGSAAGRTLGRGLVRGMPVVMRTLGTLGTAAMLWVGGGIVLHGAEAAGAAGLPQALHHLAEAAARQSGPLAALVAWLVTAAGSGLVGLGLGALVTGVVAGTRRLRR